MLDDERFPATEKLIRFCDELVARYRGLERPKLTLIQGGKPESEQEADDAG